MGEPANLFEKMLASIPRLSPEEIEHRMAEDRMTAIRDGWVDDVKTMPRMPWARRTNEKFIERLSPYLRKMLGVWQPRLRGLIIVGPTGVGKTSGLIAGLHALRTGHPDRLTRFLWTSEAELVRARAQHPLGAGESPLVRRAQAVPHLVIDEVGPSPDVPLVHATIVDRRYGNGLPTTVTSGHTLEGLGQAYGVPFVRRLVELGDVVDLHE